MPGQLIDTHDWYLTLPTGQDGGPDTIHGSSSRPTTASSST